MIKIFSKLFKCRKDTPEPKFEMKAKEPTGTKFEPEVKATIENNTYVPPKTEEVEKKSDVTETTKPKTTKKSTGAKKSTTTSKAKTTTKKSTGTKKSTTPKKTAVDK